jgi:hypothetical protein
MPSKNGFVNMWRDVRLQNWYGDPVANSIFHHLIYSASHQNRVVTFKGITLQLQPGQLAITIPIIQKTFNKVNSSKVDRVLKMFEKLKQIKHENIVSKGRSIGQKITILNWEKWQNSEVPNETPTERPDTLILKAQSTGSERPSERPSELLNNNVINNNDKEHACFENKPSHLQIRNKAFEHFWKVWGNNKKLIGKLNTAPKQTTKTKFLSIMTESHVNKMGVEQFRAEINQICELVNFAHNDIAEKQGTKQQSDFFNFESMYPAKFLGNKQWRDLNGDQE